MKRSHAYMPTMRQRHLDRLRAERALGRRIRRPEQVHHFSATQLVICPDRDYHTLLHRLEYEHRMENDPEFVEWEIARIEAQNERMNAQVQQLRLIVKRATGWTDEELERQLILEESHHEA